MSPESTALVGTDHKVHLRRDSTSRYVFPMELGRRIPVVHLRGIPNDGSLYTAPSTSACADPVGTNPDHALLSCYALALHELCQRRFHWFSECVKPDARRGPTYSPRSKVFRRAPRK